MASYAERMGLGSLVRTAPVEPEKPEEDDGFSPVSELGKGIVAGVDQLQAIGGGLVAFAGDVVGSDTIRAKGLEIYEEQMRQAAENQAKVPSYTDVTDAASAIEYASHGVGTFLPLFVPSLGAGGVGGFLAKRATQKGLKSFVERSVAKRVAAGVPEQQALRQVVGRITKAGAAAGAFASSTGLETGIITGEMHEKTGETDPLIAAGFGAIAGALDAYPAFRVLKKYGLDDEATEIVSRALTPEIIKQAGTEGVTEALQTIIERAAVKTLDESQEIFSEEGKEEILNAMILGGIGGGVIGGGTKLATRPSEQEIQDREKQAIDRVAEEGGDALSQEVAAAGAGLNAVEQRLAQEEELSSKVETLLQLFDGYSTNNSEFSLDDLDAASARLNNEARTQTEIGRVLHEPVSPTVAESRQKIGEKRKEASTRKGIAGTGVDLDTDGLTEYDLGDPRVLESTGDGSDMGEVSRVVQRQKAEEDAENARRAAQNKPPKESSTSPRVSQIDQLRQRLDMVNNQILVSDYVAENKAKLPMLQTQKKALETRIRNLENDERNQKTVGTTFDDEGLKTYGPFPKSRIPAAPHELDDLTSPEAPAEPVTQPDPEQQEFNAKGFRNSARRRQEQAIRDAEIETENRLRVEDDAAQGPLFDTDPNQMDLFTPRASTAEPTKSQPVMAETKPKESLSDLLSRERAFLSSNDPTDQDSPAAEQFFKDNQKQFREGLVDSLLGKPDRDRMQRDVPYWSGVKSARDVELDDAGLAELGLQYSQTETKESAPKRPAAKSVSKSDVPATVETSTSADPEFDAAVRYAQETKAAMASDGNLSQAQVSNHAKSMRRGLAREVAHEQKTQYSSDKAQENYYNGFMEAVDGKAKTAPGVSGRKGHEDGVRWAEENPDVSKRLLQDEDFLKSVYNAVATEQEQIRDQDSRKQFDRKNTITAVRKDTLRGRTGRATEEAKSGPYRRGHKGPSQDSVALYTPEEKVSEALNKVGISTPTFEEVSSTREFYDAINTAKASTRFGSSVYVYDEAEYGDMRLFLTEDRMAGFALKGDDVVSVFNHNDSTHSGVSVPLMLLAVQLGGRRADAFDTVLPHLYADAGFRVESRLAWDEKEAPPDWDKNTYKGFKNGEPDVVFLAYNENYDQPYTGTEGLLAKDYDEAVRIQKSFVSYPETNNQKEEAQSKRREITGKSKTILAYAEKDPSIIEYWDEPGEEAPYVVVFEGKADDAGAHTLLATSIKDFREKYKEFTVENEREYHGEGGTRSRLTDEQAYGVRADDAERYVEPLRKEFPNVPFDIVQSVDDLPQEWRAHFNRHPTARAAHDPKTGRTIVVAGHHVGEADIVKSVLHEIVGHKGVRAVLGNKANGTLLEIYKKAKNRAKLAEIAERYGLDPKRIPDRIEIAEEYLAHMAETHENPGLIQKVVARIREFLRDIGIVEEYSDGDLHNLVTKARRHVQTHRPGAENNPVSLRLRVGEADLDGINNEPESDKSRYNKLAALMTAAPEPVKDLPTRFNALTDAAKRVLLRTTPRMYLPDFVRDTPDVHSAVRSYVDEAQRMEADKTQEQEIASPKVARLDKLRREDRTQYEKLAELQSEATIAGVDPAEPAKPRKSDPLTYQAEYDRLRPMFEALSPEAQEVYREMRDAHKDQFRAMTEAIEERIASLEARQVDKNGQKVSGLDTTKIRQLLEKHRLPDPYFPLYRFGDWWASGVKNERQANEDRIFSRFETKKQRDEFLADLKKEGYRTKFGTVSEDGAAGTMDMVNPTLFSNLQNAVSKITDSAERQALEDQVHQLFLMSLPEVSMRKHMIHRKNRAGYSQDILQGFAKSMFHGAHQLARMRHMTAMQVALEDVDAAIQAQPGTPSVWGEPIRNELHERHQWAMNPRSHPLATTLNRWGFMWYLGATPAAALVNISQTPLVALPVIAARGYGYAKTMSALIKAAGEQNTMISRNIGRRFGNRQFFLDEDQKFSYPALLKQQLESATDIEESKRIARELDAYMSLEIEGLFDKTQGHDLSGLAELGERYSGFNHAWTSKISAMFHNAEVWNREVTAMATYRLSRDAHIKKGMSADDAHIAAIKEAKELTYLSHFDYTNANRPTYLQNDVMKVAFLFKQHSLNMTYRLALDAVDTIKSLKKENVGRQDLLEARKRLTGILGMTTLFAGVSGLPLFSVMAGLMNALLGDEDDPYDFEAEFRASLADIWGEEAATWVMKGPVTGATNADIASRVSLSNLWFRDPMNELEGEQLFVHYTMELLGPVYKIPTNAIRGADMVSRGYDRGYENMMPKAVRDVFKSLRYMREGVANYRGDPLISLEEMSNSDLLYQFVGFTPEKVSTQYEQNRAIKNREQHILDRRRNLLTRYALAARANDQESMRETIQMIRDYNEANPQYPLTGKTVRRSMNQRQKYSRDSVDGLNLNKNLRYLADQLNFTE